MSAYSADYLANNVLAGFIATNGPAWWNANGAYATNSLGQPNHFDGAVPVERIRELFGWDAVSSPVYVQTPLGMMPVEDKQAVMRSDTGHVMGIFSGGYVVHQYRETLIDRLSALVDGSVDFNAAGQLKNGAQGWVSMQVPDSFTTPEGIDFRPNLLAVTSHDGSLATSFSRTVTLAICDNTLSAALGEQGQKVKVKHSKHSLARLEGASDALNLIHKVAEDFAASVSRLCAVDVSDKAWSDFLEAHTPIKEDTKGRGLTMAENERATLTGLWNADPRVSPWKGTAFGVVQAVNTYVHHEAIVRGASREERNMSRAVTGGVDALDLGTLATLSRVLEMELVSA